MTSNSCSEIDNESCIFLTAIKNLSKDKSVNRGSPPSARGSNDISVIVDGDRDGKITSTGSAVPATTNSQIKCTACYVSTSTDEDMWIRIDLVDNYFVTEINVFTGELLMKYYVRLL